VSRRIFRPEREQVRPKWIKLRKEELHNLYSSSNTIRVIKLLGLCGHGMWYALGK
jgi:hypothetical protein